ncbi:thiol reductant ABC exporter subunit CydC [Halobacillus andaensis]|uniref:Thiol reductant ABC exporter subunit CydC n=1 Tax=Halobacillus andaensis TaxID=1176239 RepID=A0A917F163_HALAA|nr:thiol reductant ABC exporter subunit CydC [Halobacillus andaensis]MBP2006371.1 ATP-binding cassette subfamily C protein CydC [Halobacillus andaensis]GGF34640.1 thiol reductant ABC exporter subunit CydC [Halobacillus andaensis]
MKDLGIVVKLVMLEQKDILLSIFFGFLAGIAAVGLFASSGYLISRAAFVPPLYALTVVIAILKLFGFTRALSRYAERYFSHRATFSILSHLRVSFYKKIEPLAPQIFQKYRSGDLLSRIVGDVESLQNFFLRVYYPPIVLVIVFLSTIVFTTFYSLAIAIVLLLGLLLTGFVVPALFTIRQKRINTQVRENRGALSTEAAELLYGYRDLKIYQKLEEKEEQLLHASHKYVNEQEREGLHSTFSHSMNTMVSLIISWFVLGLGAWLVVEDDLNGIFLAMLVMVSLTVFENATPMAVFPVHLEDSRRASNRLFSVVREEPAKEPESPVRLSVDQAPSIRFHDVSFSFNGEKRQALEKVNVSIPQGSKTAIVGASGSGKSTLLQLLLNIHPYQEGDIQLNDVSLNKVEREELWARSNVVLQENHFFYGSIRHNLEVAAEGLGDHVLIEALQKVKLDHFSLEDEVLERGENLSGGEKQRLAIARAMLKGERLWLLDEPTSSVDALTEKMLYEELFAQAKEDTVLLVSHRLAGLEKMDQIIVMEQGEVVESGTFRELMAQQGYFYEMKQIEKSVFL